MKKKKISDFRYESGHSAISWAAVGEQVREPEILEFVKFLIQPVDGGTKKYGTQFKKVAKEINALASCGKFSGKLTLGNNVLKLENQVKRLLKAKHVVFLTNATAGFEIAYKFAGLKPGDEVIAPALTFIATIAYPLSIGAKVVLADVDSRTLNMDPNDVAKKITNKTKVIIPVHLGGYPVDMDPIMRLARKRGITVIEDGAHAFGAQYKGKMVGTIGDFGAFSFHEVKNVTALGEGGILATNTKYGESFSEARFVNLALDRQIRNWLYDITALKGKGGKFFSNNNSATEIQAICLSSQMKRMKEIIAKRKRAGEYLNRRFRNIEGIITPKFDGPGVKSTYHLYLLQIDPVKTGGDVQVLRKKLQKMGITEVPHFAPLYKFSVMRELGYDTAKIQNSCPVAEEAFNHRFTHLPLYDFSDEQLKYMADKVIECVEEMKAGK